MKNSSSLVNVRFFDQIEHTTFMVGDLDIKYGQKVVALSNRGKAIGVVNSSPFFISDTEKIQTFSKIIKIATNQDIEDCKKIYQDQRRSGDIFCDIVSKHGLCMDLVHFEYTSLGKKIIFYYKASTRVDFRELLKSLRNKFSIQIELRQLLNGEEVKGYKIGPCGMELCLFIKSTVNDSSLINKCSENKCCLDFKDPFYEDRLAPLPKIGDYIKTHTDEVGRVEKLDVVREEFDLLTDKGVIKRYTSHMFNQKLNKKPASFLAGFETISRETSPDIGQEDLERKQQDVINCEAVETIKRNKEFVERNFELLLERSSLNNAVLKANE